MRLSNVFRAFQRKPLVLTVQFVEQKMHYMLCSKRNVVQTGWLSSCIDFDSMGDLTKARLELLAQLGHVKADVGVLLPLSQVYIHYLYLPIGLDQEELAYQVMRHVTQELHFDELDVYCDWCLVDADVAVDAVAVKNQPVVLLLARRSQVDGYARLFEGAGLNVRWVCAEPLMWAKAFEHEEGRFYAVCRVEHSCIQFYGFDPSGRIRYAERFLDESLQNLPDGLSALILKRYFEQWCACDAQKSNIKMVYVLGSGLNWERFTPEFATQIGLSVRIVPDAQNNHFEYSTSPCFSALWQFSEQISSELS